MPSTVEIIEGGTVIDHIAAGQGLRVMRILRLAGGDSIPPLPVEIHLPPAPRMVLLINVPSRQMGQKDILKLEGRTLSQQEADQIALVAPQATLNTLVGGKCVKKQPVRQPAKLEGIAACPNSNCISQSQNLPGRFALHGGRARCHYCERLFKPEELAI